MIYEKQIGYSRVNYNDETGIFTWVRAYRKPHLTGKIATREMSNGYLYIKANNNFHSASRLAIELSTGVEVPNNLVVDHINRNTKDNRIINLRVVTQKVNMENASKKIGLTGVSGVSIYNYPSGNGFLYRTRKGGKTKYHKTIEEAKEALL